MRIITWNCRRKTAEKALRVLEPFHPDLVVFQELTQRGAVPWRRVHGSIAYGEETDPTHYWLFRESAPFHIDFVFLPQSWPIENVQVGSFAEWRRHSDHVPVIVDVSV